MPHSVDLVALRRQPHCMTVVPIPLPVHGRWAWDVRGEGRAVRVSTHVESGLLNVSMWRDEVCVGTARLLPAEAARLVGALTDGLAELAEQPFPGGRLHELELRLARLEADRPEADRPEADRPEAHRPEAHRPAWRRGWSAARSRLRGSGRSG